MASQDGAEFDFATDRVVVLVRGVRALLARSRASDRSHADTVPLK